MSKIINSTMFKNGYTQGLAFGKMFACFDSFTTDEDEKIGAGFEFDDRVDGLYSDNNYDEDFMDGFAKGYEESYLESISK